MISEDLVKQRFVHDTISQGINLIYETQIPVQKNTVEFMFHRIRQ